MSLENNDRLEYALRGKAWRVYWLLLKTGRPMSVREVQKALHFSSPSVASHHLEQLSDLGLLEKQPAGGNYLLVNQIKIGVLRHFVKLGRMLFPRYFFYALFVTTLFLTYLLLAAGNLTRESAFILFFGTIVSSILWYETYRVWTLKPF